MKNFIYNEFMRNNLFIFFLFIIGIYIYAFKFTKEAYYNANEIDDCKNELNNVLNDKLKYLDNFFTKSELNKFNLDISKAINKIKKLTKSENYSTLNVNTKNKIDLITLKLNNVQNNLMSINQSISAITTTNIPFIKNIENKTDKSNIPVKDSVNITTNHINDIIKDLSEIPDF